MIECKTSQFADELLSEVENKGFVASFYLAHNRPIDIRKFKEDVIRKWR